MNCNVIATGSSGNAVILADTILLDCGVPFKALEPHLRAFRLVLLTHIHGDHFNPATVRRLAQERPLLRFGCCPWMVGPLIQQSGVRRENIDVYDPECGAYFYDKSVGVIPFLLPHDVDNCGYKIRINGEYALYATDTASLDGVEAPGYDLYMIEANFREKELEERIRRKTEAGEFVYEYREAASHLSMEKADAWLMANATPGKSQVVYLHGHQEMRSEARRLDK